MMNIDIVENINNFDNVDNDAISKNENNDKIR